MNAVEIFADVGEIVHEQGFLREGLEMLAFRLDYIGAGELVAEILHLEFTPRSEDKPNPHPTPVPKPPPPPPPRPGPKGQRS